MKIKFIHSTNSYLYAAHKNAVGEILISTQGTAIFKNQHHDEGFITSLIDTIKQENNILTIKTLNSVYQFEVLSGGLSDLNLSPLEKNRGHLKNLQVYKNKKYISYHCRIGGHSSIDQRMSTTRLPQPMTRAEAIEFLDNAVLLDIDGEIVTSILSPIVQTDITI